MNPKVDEFLNRAHLWREEIEQLRMIALECGLAEELKWRQPCYTFQKKNILLISAFKDFCVISFLKGALLKDTHNLLTQAGENTQSARIIKFTNVQEIIKQELNIKAYIHEAIAVEQAGLKVDFKQSANLTFPDEFLTICKQNENFKNAFEAMTPGRQRGYNLHFTAPKQSGTRTSRIEKSIPRILNGYGIHDCTCGHSKKMPNCDGSHKNYPEDKKF